MMVSALERALERADLECESHRKDTPLARSADATRGRIVESAASSIKRVSTALQAAGYPVLASIKILTDMSASAST